MKTANILSTLALALVAAGCETLYRSSDYGYGGRGAPRGSRASYGSSSYDDTDFGASYGQQPVVSENTRAQAARDQAARDAEIAKATAESAESQIQQMDLRLARLEDTARTSAGAGSHEVAALREQVAALQSEVAALRADRAKLKAEIRDEIGGDIAKLLAKHQGGTSSPQPRPSSSAAAQTGYEHKVQSGQTLSAIAVAYGVSVEKIKKANNLKSDSIRVGQTLFIPD